MKNTTSRRNGFTIVELFMSLCVTTIVFAAVYVFYAGHVAQSRQITDYLSLQRDTREVIVKLRKDLMALIEVIRAERDENQTMTVLEFEVPVGVDLTAPVRWEYDKPSRKLKKNGVVQLDNSMKDLQIWFLDRDDRDVFDTISQEGVFGIRFRAQIEAISEGSIPNSSDKRNRDRVIDFTIYPRIPVSRSKAKEGKLNLSNGRFPVTRRSSGRLTTDLLGTN